MGFAKTHKERKMNTFNRKGLLLWFCADVEVVDNKTSIPMIQEDKKSLYSTTVTVISMLQLQQTGNTAIQ